MPNHFNITVWNSLWATAALLCAPALALAGNTEEKAPESYTQKATPYPHRDIRSVEATLAEKGVKRASHGRIVITIWGSTDRVRSELKLAADDLYAEGVPVSLYYAGATYRQDNAAIITFHANGERVGYGLVGRSNSNVREKAVELGLDHARKLGYLPAELSFEINIKCPLMVA